MPKWHEDARRMRENGMGVARIARELNAAGIMVSDSRVSQVTNANWQWYMERDRVRSDAIKEEVDKAKKEGRTPDTKAAINRMRAERKANMTDRVFDKVTSSDPSDVYHRVRVRCSHNGCTEQMVFARRGIINPNQAAHWFRDKGWGVGGGPRADLCPKHFKGVGHHEPEPEVIEHPPVPEVQAKLVEDIENATAQVINDANVVAQVTDQIPLEHEVKEVIGKLPMPQPVVNAFADVVPTPSRTEKRIIYSKLNDLYIDEFVGYRDDWSDAKLAKDLGVPETWVALIREEDFGPDTNQTLSAQAAAFDSKMAEFHEKAKEIKELVAAYDTITNNLDEKIDAFELLVGEIKGLLINKEKKA